MNNADRFKQTFGIYAEEFWSFDEKQMLDWLNADVPDRNVGDMIFRQDAIDATWEKMTYTEPWNVLTEVRNRLKALPPAQPERKKGKWLNDRGLYRCSSCNQLLAEWWAVSKPIEFMKEECPYCPMCGSYNGEETDDE